MTRSNGISFANGGLDYGEYALDQEIKGIYPNWIKIIYGLQSETSDDRSSKDDKSNSESIALDIESELDLWSEAQIIELIGPAQDSLRPKVKILKGPFYI